MLEDIKARPPCLWIGMALLDSCPTMFLPQAQNTKFKETRLVDPSIREREARLKELDTAYEKYLSIQEHLEEGYKVQLFRV